MCEVDVQTPCLALLYKQGVMLEHAGSDCKVLRCIQAHADRCMSKKFYFCLAPAKCQSKCLQQ